MLKWLQQYNTHNKEIKEIDTEFRKMHQEEQESAKKFYETHKEFYTKKTEDPTATHETSPFCLKPK
ncbi:hypothetical protein [Legionella parisiensis]|uniref:Uncharacterized protein n=1 Tax=Legionella parisiensis TaxID=45071 RepID=A0A1E5JP53_9GAMM|nr:hypothetical protein [Legionella parisiensis]KTD41424.1 hypothetical protein Lpar_2741 [Legionella parisiensis]OEH45818.1 hypothetical protein lpari_03225 [Legionella parisiensis]STX76272.1 Uncharacterised protein [Legionella parisiensis]